jgi:hypothetical protein
MLSNSPSRKEKKTSLKENKEQMPNIDIKKVSS